MRVLQIFDGRRVLWDFGPERDVLSAQGYALVTGTGQRSGFKPLSRRFHPDDGHTHRRPFTRSQGMALG